MTWLNTILTFAFLFLDTLIARMTKQSVADVGGPWVEEEQRWGGPGAAHLRLTYRVTCAAHYYGAGCEVLCRPRDDSFGHYTCSPTGAIVCKPGWTGDYCSKRKLLCYLYLRLNFNIIRFSL
jgi:delta